MSHYDTQREEQARKQLGVEAYEQRYDCYINGTLQSAREAVPEDLMKYMEPEFYDFLKVLAMGAKKHGNSNWLNVDGKKSSHKDMHASMFRHLAQSYANQRLDDESGLDHLLHLASRALMVYTRLKKGLIHSEDK